MAGARGGFEVSYGRAGCRIISARRPPESQTRGCGTPFTVDAVGQASRLGGHRRAAALLRVNRSW